MRPLRGLWPLEESTESRASVEAASERLAGCDKNSEVERGLWPLEESTERPSVDVEVEEI